MYILFEWWWFGEPFLWAFFCWFQPWALSPFEQRTLSTEHKALTTCYKLTLLPHFGGCTSSITAHGSWMQFGHSTVGCTDACSAWHYTLYITTHVSAHPHQIKLQTWSNFCDEIQSLHSLVVFGKHVVTKVHVAHVANVALCPQYYMTAHLHI